MKSREQKKKDLEALTKELSTSKSAMVVSFTNLTVDKDQEMRSQLREAGAKYQVVKNTLARIAVKDTPYEGITEHLKGVTAIAWTDKDPVDLSKTVSSFIKENDKIFTFKTGVVEGKVVGFEKVTEIASLPSKDALIGKFLYLLNAPAQRLATVLSAIPRDLAIVLNQVSEGKGSAQTAEEAEAKEEPKEEAKASETVEAKEEPKQEEAKDSTEAKEESSEKVDDSATEEVKAETAPEETAEAETSNEEFKAETEETSDEDAEAEKSE